MTDPDPAPLNNMAAVRVRAELFADRIQQHGMTPLQTGYVAVCCCLDESARQIRMAAELGLTQQQLLAVADQLEAIAEDTVLLGQAQTQADGGG